jgi:hypothetical protein
MSTVQEDILKAFYAKLGLSQEFDKAMIDEVRTLLGSDKKLKADDLVAVLVKGKQEGAL